LIGGVSGYATTGTVQCALIGAGSGRLTGTTLRSGILASSVIGAVANIGTQLASGATIANLNYTSVGIAAIAGVAGVAAGIGASNLLQVPFGVIGRPVGTAGLNVLSNSVFMLTATNWIF
jgi:hypothetical protein